MTKDFSPSLPSIELLEATHKFPGDYTFKAIGNHNDLFARQCVAAARTALALENDPSHRERESSGGKHIAVTLNLRVQSAHDVHLVYRRLLAIPDLILLF